MRFLFVNNRELIHYPFGAYFRWKGNCVFQEEVLTGDLIIRYKGLLGILSGNAGVLRISGAEKYRFVKEYEGEFDLTFNKFNAAKPISNPSV